MPGRIPAIVLAGGASSRMGSPKALLSDGRETFLARIARTLQASGVGEMVVVTGVHHDPLVTEIAAWSEGWPVRALRNDAPGADQLSSLRLGLDAIDRDGVEAALVALVDHPFVAPATVRALLRAFRDSGAPVVRPTFRGHHGHPVVFARESFTAIRTVPPAMGAKAVVRAYGSRVLDVEVDDEGAWTDIDTPDAYRAALARFAAREP